MIGYIRGIILKKQPPMIIIEVHGIGYEVITSMMTYEKLGALNQPIELYTHFIVREDSQMLYGFFAELERKIFRLLIKVNGIGPKVALSLLSSVEGIQLLQAIDQQNITFLVKQPGIGKKTAERLVIETKDKIATLLTKEQLITQEGSNKLDRLFLNATHEAMEALVSLGYKALDAKKIILKLPQDIQDSALLIRMALSQLAK